MNAVDDVIAKIKKAVRLANGTHSDAERDTAMRLARNLAEKNGLALEDIESQQSADRAVQEDDDAERDFDGPETGFALCILRDHFAVVVVANREVTRMDDGKVVRSRKVRLTWFGPRVNIHIARYAYDILIRESRGAYRRLKKIVPELDRKGFMQGFFCAVYAKLRENPLRNDLEAEKKATEAKYIEYRRDHSVKQSRRAGAGKGARAEGSASIGYCMGEKVALSRPCENRGESVRAIGAEAV